MPKTGVREYLQSCIAANEHCIKYGFVGNDDFLEWVIREYVDNMDFVDEEYSEETAKDDAIYTAIMKWMPKETPENQKPENQKFAYECFWNFQFGEESLTITKILKSEKDLDRVTESIGSNDGYSFYYCDTLKEAVCSVPGIVFKNIEFNNISDEEIEQVKPKDENILSAGTEYQVTITLTPSKDINIAEVTALINKMMSDISGDEKVTVEFNEVDQEVKQRAKIREWLKGCVENNEDCVSQGFHKYDRFIDEVVDMYLSNMKDVEAGRRKPGYGENEAKDEAIDVTFACWYDD